jgi:6,7-dimethyl-8-ribityllumazine synthase
VKRGRFTIVVADYHRKYADGMVNAARKVLQGHRVEEVRVPGTFEVPLAVKRALRKKPDAVLALGLVWQGETPHAGLILKSATDALMRMMLQSDTPVLHHLVGVKTEAQARARCLGRLNRGQEAAQAALRMWKLKAGGRRGR